MIDCGNAIRYCRTVKEMRATRDVFVGLYGTSLVLIDPANERHPCSVGVYDRIRGQPRIRGGAPGWTAGAPESFTLKGV